jgi:acid phosphatase
VQTSAEYRALCLQIFRNAETIVLARARTSGDAKPKAVALDLDETVIDNSGFQTWLYRNQTNYSSAAWAQWTQWQAREGRARGVPGATQFLQAMERAGVAAVYISNRRESEREATVASLKRLGIEEDDPGDRLLLRRADSGKEPRREQVRARWNVIAYFGDNLADFAPELEAQGTNWQEREAAAESARERWGVDWFVLPNPMYGDWVQSLGEPLEDGLQGPSDFSAPQGLQSQ